MAQVTYFRPNTDGEIRIPLDDISGNPVTSGTVVATKVMSPTGALLASNVSLSFVSGNIWKLVVPASWSVSSGQYILGEYTAIIVATYSGTTSTMRVRWPVQFDDNT